MIFGHLPVAADQMLPRNWSTVDQRRQLLLEPKERRESGEDKREF